MDRNPPSDAPQLSPKLEAGDYYFEGPYLVFTAAYHLKRSFCCESGCRHCPYGGIAEGKATADPSTASATPDSAQDDKTEG
jgi:hypothetical protein